MSLVNKQRIPQGYFLGVNPKDRLLINDILETTKLDEFQQVGVIELGSGKGYISRIISSHYKIPIFCVDSIRERLASSMRVQQLINDDKVLEYANKTAGTFNMFNYQNEIQSRDDFVEIWYQAMALRQFKEVKTVVILGVKLCGDFFYNMVDWIAETRALMEGFRVEIVVVPCCLHKSIRSINLDPVQEMVRYAHTLSDRVDVLPTTSSSYKIIRFKLS
ncbi:hypothetical protein JL09_g4663 [Pichia kudriavzevii]|uniref:Methyltransferase domain-containing protein n=1 Tax=Pichia kudriavzevii TaxID=4909 RepID=A0A099NW58_PICKU|nr:hypothetical protein JL09_g4663 [Pichia kudriavzevii]